MKVWIENLPVTLITTNTELMVLLLVSQHIRLAYLAVQLSYNKINLTGWFHINGYIMKNITTVKKRTNRQWPNQMWYPIINNVSNKIKWIHLSWRRWRWQVWFCKPHPCNNANSQNDPSKYVILQITALLFLLSLKNKQKN